MSTNTAHLHVICDISHAAEPKDAHVTSVPLCGGELPDLTSDELYCKHLRIVNVTNESKDLEGERKEIQGCR